MDGLPSPSSTCHAMREDDGEEVGGGTFTEGGAGSGRTFPPKDVPDPRMGGSGAQGVRNGAGRGRARAGRPAVDGVAGPIQGDRAGHLFFGGAARPGCGGLSAVGRGVGRGRGGFAGVENRGQAKGVGAALLLREGLRLAATDAWISGLYLLQAIRALPSEMAVLVGRRQLRLSEWMTLHRQPLHPGLRASV